MTPTIPPPPRLPSGVDQGFRARGPWGSVVVPTAVVCALITAAMNFLLRPTAPAQAATTADTALREDMREIRQDVKQILSRLGALEDYRQNDAVVRGARGAGPTP